MATADFKTQVRRAASTVLGGTLLAIDPASGGTSLPGWAAYSKGRYLDGGVLEIAGKRVQERLRVLYELLEETKPDVLVIERIRGSRAHAYLQWAVGVSVAAACPHTLLEIPISTWKKFAGKNHVKSDLNDARAMGDCVIDLASSRRPA